MRRQRVADRSVAIDQKLTSKLRLRRIGTPIVSTHKIHTLCLAQDWSAVHGND